MTDQNPGGRSDEEVDVLSEPTRSGVGNQT